MGQYNTRNRLDEELNPTNTDLIRKLPLELSLAVLSHLNATDLCLAGCVWNDLAYDETLWMGLCRNWGYHHSPEKIQSFRKLYLILDEGSLIFSANAEKGMKYFLNNGLIKDDPKEIANFLNCTDKLSFLQVCHYLGVRGDVLDHFIGLQNFKGVSLPNALRALFSRTLAEEIPANYLHTLLDKFSRRFYDCNQHLKLPPDTIYIVSFSLIILSVDFSSPHVKNKMSKREFIRNVRRAIGHRIDDDWCGHLYDDVIEPDYATQFILLAMLRQVGAVTPPVGTTIKIIDSKKIVIRQVPLIIDMLLGPQRDENQPLVYHLLQSMRGSLFFVKCRHTPLPLNFELLRYHDMCQLTFHLVPVLVELIKPFK